MNLKMRLFKEKYGICRLESESSIPEWARAGEFFSITKTLDELSIVCAQHNVPEEVKCEKDWRALKVEGPLDFSLIGILDSISTALAEKDISIFAISTYDTDYVLIKETDLDKAIIALSKKGFEIKI